MAERTHGGGNTVTTWREVPMSVMEYCYLVHRLLLEADVCPTQGFQYCLDRVNTLIAVGLAADGHDDDALQLAEDIARRWDLPV